MLMKMFKTQLAIAAFICSALFCVDQCNADAPSASRGVVERLSPELSKRVTFKQISAGDDGRDVYEYQCSGNKLTIRGSTGVAMCRGLYDYLKDNGLGMVSWGGTRLDLPRALPDAALHRVVTPYQKRFYLNVVTYGYSMPYWDWPRWEKEIDWMALHGINLPISFVGAEAIGQRVFKQIGLTQHELNSFYTGPAHLPWMRMGNVTGIDGPPPEGWNDDQVALQHKILERMRELSIEPIAPAFAGFVPKAIQRIYPDAALHESAWAGFPSVNHAYMLPPDSKPFAEISRAYVQEWEREFGKAKYFSADSFNEMQLPKESRSVPDMLADYGKAQYDAIAAGDPDAVWVLQGWMLGYQRDIWTPQNVEALVSKVPNTGMLILDEACDYNKIYWKNGYNFERDDGFYGKPWVWGVIPNMGGKTGWTGKLDFYAAGLADAAKSNKRGAMVGMGFAPEGIENNDVIYELVADQAWKNDPLDLDSWLQHYCSARYGSCPAAMSEAWELFRQSCYGTFTDHPRLGWQTLMFGRGSMNHDPKFTLGVAKFLSCSDALHASPLYKADAIELSAIVLSLRAEDWFALASQSINAGGDARPLFDKGIKCLDDADRLLASHPLDRLDRWLDFARSHGKSDEEKSYYEENARRIITVWGPPINDYSARIWSGLIRDFYKPRMIQKFEAMLSGKPFDRALWEEQWVHGHGVSPIERFPDPLAGAVQLVTAVMNDNLPAPPERENLGTWSPDQVTEEYATIDWPITADQLTKLSGVEFVYTDGAHRLDVKSVALIADGQEIDRDDHFGYAGLPNDANVYHFPKTGGVKANNGCIIRAVVKGDGGHDSRGFIAAIVAPQGH